MVKRIFGSHFVYDGMDYIKVVTNEIRSIHQILNMFGIEPNPIDSSFHPEIEILEEAVAMDDDTLS